MPAPRGGRRLRSETTTTRICPAISGATQYSPCFECSRLVDLSLLKLAQSSKLKSQLASQLLNFPSSALRPPLRQNPCLSIRSAHPQPPLAGGGARCLPAV